MCSVALKYAGEATRMVTMAGTAGAVGAVGVTVGAEAVGVAVTEAAVAAAVAWMVTALVVEITKSEAALVEVVIAMAALAA